MGGECIWLPPATLKMEAGAAFGKLAAPDQVLVIWVHHHSGYCLGSWIVVTTDRGLTSSWLAPWAGDCGR